MNSVGNHTHTHTHLSHSSAACPFLQSDSLESKDPPTIFPSVSPALEKPPRQRWSLGNACGMIAIMVIVTTRSHPLRKTTAEMRRRMYGGGMLEGGGRGGAPELSGCNLEPSTTHPPPGSIDPHTHRKGERSHSGSTAISTRQRKRWWVGGPSVAAFIPGGPVAAFFPQPALEAWGGGPSPGQGGPVAPSPPEHPPSPSPLPSPHPSMSASASTGASSCHPRPLGFPAIS